MFRLKTPPYYTKKKTNKQKTIKQNKNKNKNSPEPGRHKHFLANQSILKFPIRDLCIYICASKEDYIHNDQYQ